MPLDLPEIQIIAKADSSASHHYWREQDAHCLTNLIRNSSISVMLPNTESIPSTIQCQISLAPELTPKAQYAIVLPQLKSSSLMSLGQLCNDNCSIHLTKRDMKVYKNEKLLLSGSHNYKDGL